MKISTVTDAEKIKTTAEIELDVGAPQHAGASILQALRCAAITERCDTCTV